MSKPKGRFEIQAVFTDGAYMRFTSHKERSLPPDEIAKCLREYADMIDRASEPKRTEPEEPPA